jgi:hypothetical protein
MLNYQRIIYAFWRFPLSRSQTGKTIKQTDVGSPWFPMVLFPRVFPKCSTSKGWKKSPFPEAQGVSGGSQEGSFWRGSHESWLRKAAMATRVECWSRGGIVHVRVPVAASSRYSFISLGLPHHPTVRLPESCQVMREHYAKTGQLQFWQLQRSPRQRLGQKLGKPWWRTMSILE